MKKKVFISALAIFLTISFNGFSQNRVVLQSNGTTTVFGTADSFRDAYNAADDGDTIYLPGLQYTSPNPFNKSLVVYGTGHDPESTVSTGRTIISGFTFDPGATGSHLEGLYINSSIVFRSGNKIDDITLKRVHINGGISITGTNPLSRCNNILITESVFSGLNAQNASNIRVFNSFSNSGFSDLNENSWIANSIIIDTFYPLRFINLSLVENSILISRTTSSGFPGVSDSDGNNFRNNIFNKNPTAQEENNWENNFVNVLPADLFIDYVAPFSYDGDYHLQDPGAYTGSTGDQSGLFGGYHPFKENALPVTPHILDHDIATSADQEGNLQISVSVQAQDQ